MSHLPITPPVQGAPAHFIDQWPTSGAEKPLGTTCPTCSSATEAVPEVPGLRRCPRCRERKIL